MVPVAGGTFLMGSTAYLNEQPVHSVTLSPFYMGKYEVTQEQYEAVIGNNPSYFTSGADAGEIQSKRPVEQVSWYDMLVFCNTVSIAEGLTSAYSIGGSTDPADWGTVPTSSDAAWNAVTCNWSANGYRLPTEAEWEYAARGGDGSPGNYEYSGSNTVGDVAWYNDNSGAKTHEVGKKAPNNLGLYDMSGNVWELCWDWWYGTYQSGAQDNPLGASLGSYRVDRGGSWYYSVQNARSAFRYYETPSYRHYTLGFRLVRSGL